MIIVEPLLEPALDDLARILEMFKKIPGRTCTADAFLDYLQSMWQHICLIVIFDNAEVVGFTVAERPSLLQPKIGWLPFSYVLPHIKHKYAKKGFIMAEEWLREQGAEIMRFTSVRKPNALKRVYGMTPSKEVLYEKRI